MKKYNKEFYRLMVDQTRTASNLSSAEEIVPYILKLLPNTKSIVDVGGAIGTWASVFKKHGINKILDIDGPWVDKSSLLISMNEFEVFDLGSGEKYSAKERYDIAICLEVAEHINERYADMLVDMLANLSDIIIFSAAIENQGGTNHVNEQYQSYWKKKFQNKGYQALDPIRGKFTDNERVLPEYTQNMLLYVKDGKIFPELTKFYNIPFVVDIVNPKNRYVKCTNTWKYIWYMQYLVLRAIIKKLFK